MASNDKNFVVKNGLTVGDVSNATGDFATVSATGVLQKRTAAQTLTDIGAAASSDLSDYLPLTGGTLSDTLTINAANSLKIAGAGGANGGSILAKIFSIDAPIITYANTPNRLVVGSTLSNFRIDSTSDPTVLIGSTTSTLWHSGNDGADSTLDADLLDGNHASAFSLSSHNHTLDSLSNTTITSNSSGEVLVWNGSAWVNRTLAEASISSTSHNHTLDSLSNVTISANSSGEILKWNGSAWINNTLAEAGIAATGDIPTVNNGTLTLAVAGTGLSGSASFTANQSGGSTFTVTSNATNANTASTLVARDGSGNFSAGTITATLSGTATQVSSALTAGTGLTSSGTFNGSTARTFAIDSTVATLTGSQALTNKTYEGLTVATGTNTFTLTRGSSTLVRSGAHAMTLTTTGATDVTFPTTGTLATTAQLPTVNNATLTMNVSGTGLSGSQTFTANQASGATFTVTSNATSANTNSTIVARDGSGNFSAGTITAALSGNATSATSAATWTTGRTITIGSTGKSVNGSANVSWSLGEIGAAAVSHDHTLASLTDVDMTGLASGDILVYDGAEWLPETASSGASISWSARTSNYTASANDGIMANTTSSSWTLTLPASPSLGDVVAVIDSHGTFAVNNLIIARNGQNIQGVAENLEADIANSSFELVFSGATDGWKIKTFPGNVLEDSMTVLYGTGSPPSPTGIAEGTVYFMHEA